jgi:hypothetical protein
MQKKESLTITEEFLSSRFKVIDSRTIRGRPVEDLISPYVPDQELP